MLVRIPTRYASITPRSTHFPLPSGPWHHQRAVTTPRLMNPGQKAKYRAEAARCLHNLYYYVIESLSALAFSSCVFSPLFLIFAFLKSFQWKSRGSTGGKAPVLNYHYLLHGNGEWTRKRSGDGLGISGYHSFLSICLDAHGPEWNLRI